MSENKVSNEPADEIEKAIFDLQDVKNNYEVEKREFDAKNVSNTPNLLHQTDVKRPQTQGGIGVRRHITGDLMNDPDAGLHGEMDKMSIQDLKERLVVAEKVMKSLFQRNKDLEENATNDAATVVTAA